MSEYFIFNNSDLSAAFKKNPVDLLFFGDSQMHFMSFATNFLRDHYSIEGLKTEFIGIDIIPDFND